MDETVDVLTTWTWPIQIAAYLISVLGLGYWFVTELRHRSSTSPALAVACGLMAVGGGLVCTSQHGSVMDLVRRDGPDRGRHRSGGAGRVGCRQRRIVAIEVGCSGTLTRRRSWVIPGC